MRVIQENGRYLVQINLWKTGRYRRWVKTMLHELRHVALYEDNVCSPHHETKSERMAFDVPVNEVVKWITNTDTLARFDAWMKYYKRERMPYDRVQKAAEGTLSGRMPPSE